MAAWPMDLVKGSRSTQREREDVVEERSQTQTEIQQIRANVSLHHVLTLVLLGICI